MASLHGPCVVFERYVYTCQAEKDVSFIVNAFWLPAGMLFQPTLLTCWLRHLYAL
jgi:hypothetical protein